MNEERHYRRRENIIILDYLDFTWTKDKMYRCKALWEQGISIDEIAKDLKRDCMEVFLLLYHLVTMNWIKEREGSIWGCKND